MKGKSATHGFIDGLADGQLSQTTFGPEALQDLATMLDLNKGACLIVAATPESHKLLARFHGPGL